ncbi:MAG: MAPEG family protein [Pseudomonadota bacterium]
MPAPITALYASFIGLLMTYLALRVVAARRREKVGLGAGGSQAVEHAMRVQANAVENAPIALLLIALLELNGGAAWLIHALGAALLFARLFHLQGFGGNVGVSPGRVIGTVVTLLTIQGAAVANVVMFFLRD